MRSNQLNENQESILMNYSITIFRVGLIQIQLVSINVHSISHSVN